MSYIRPVPSASGGGANARIPEDILRSLLPTATAAEKASILLRRGPLVWAGNPGDGHPALGQHFQGSGLARTPVSTDGRSGGRLVTGRGQEADGYGSADDGAGIYLRLGVDQQDCYYTLSGRFQIRAEVPGASTNFTLYFDSQSADNQYRQYPKLVYNTSDSKWKIGNAGSPVSVPGAIGLMLGDNEDKQGSIYIAFSFYFAANWVDSHWGHLQVGGQVFDLRQIGNLGAPDTPQVGSNPFALGRNVGVGASTPTAGKWGGFCIDRMEVTCGDVLV